jgi:hypothetical protein
MANDDYDDEDWYDDDAPEEESECPECGESFAEIAGRCPACGYWISDADRPSRWSAAGRPLWVQLTAVVLLLAFLVSLIAFGGVF